ncbi:hypothetical protein BDW62DRAFT_126075 [Aspergillus aurantiobrunneus]
MILPSMPTPSVVMNDIVRVTYSFPCYVFYLTHSWAHVSFIFTYSLRYVCYAAKSIPLENKEYMVFFLFSSRSNRIHTNRMCRSEFLTRGFFTSLSFTIFSCLYRVICSSIKEGTMGMDQ